MLVVLAGCYAPTVQLGLPCSESGACPGDQVCDQTQSPPTCGATRVDAGGVDVLDSDASLQSCSAGCGGAAPVCDQPTQTCRGCIADAECPSDVCHEMTGECVAEGHAVYIAPGGTGTTCTRTSPCGTIAEADEQLTALRHTIKVADGRYPERLDLKMQNGVTSIVLSGPDRTPEGPVIVASLGGHRSENGLTAVIEGVSLVDSPQRGFEAFGSLTLSRVLVRASGEAGVSARGQITRILDSRIEAGVGRGVVINNGTGTIERTVIIANRGGGIAFENGAGFAVVNSIIANNGTPETANPGVRIAGPAQLGGLASFRFNTIAGNRTLGTVAGIECNRAVLIESSILANPNAMSQEMSSPCTAQTSLFAASAPATGGNLTGDPMFVGASDFHVLPGSPAVNAAPAAMAPLLDVDGQPRGGADLPDIGADELP